MDSELNSLYNLMHVYKQSINKTLTKIDENVLLAIRSFDFAQGNTTSEKKYKLTMEILDTLTTLVKISYTTNNLANEFVKKLAFLDRDSQPEREITNSNPFASPNQELTEIASCSSAIPEADSFLSLSLEKLSEIIKVEASQSETKQIVEVAESEESFQSALETSTDTIKEEESEVEASSVPQETTLKKRKGVTFNLSEDKIIPRNTKNVIKASPKSPVYDWREQTTQMFQVNKERKKFKWKAPAPKAKVKQSKENKATNYGTVDQFSSLHNLQFLEICEDDFTKNCTFVVVHVVSPSEFYVCTELELLNELDLNFNDYLNNHCPYVVNRFKSKEDARACFGNFCFCFIEEDNKWYRVEILDWMEDEEPELVLMQLIDYGQTRYSKYNHLKQMTETYSIVPKMAIRCHLAAIRPPSPTSDRWPKKSIDFFTELCKIDERTQFKPIWMEREGNSYSIEFRKVSEDVQIGNSLVQAGYATLVAFSEEENLDEDDIEECETIGEAVAGYNATDEARICPFSDSSGKCFKGANCKLEHAKLSEDGVTTDKFPTVQNPYKELDLPSTGEYVNVLITGYINTCHFYAHILKSGAKEAHNEEYQKLSEVINANNLVQTYEPFKILPGLGELLLIKQESQWYRGRCVGYKDDKKLEVFLVDFGETIIKNLKELRMMKEDLLYIPFQAVECILNNCQEKKGASSLESRNFFKEFMQGKTLRGYVVESNIPLRLNLQDDEHQIDLAIVLKQYALGEDRREVFPDSKHILAYN